MENIAIKRLMRLIDPLSVELKLEILSKLSEKLKIDFHTKKSTKENLLEELFGSWSSVNDNLADEIMNRRSSSTRDIGFD